VGGKKGVRMGKGRIKRNPKENDERKTPRG
jgi:hypothetical protein